jgi:hypothetical protein
MDRHGAAIKLQSAVRGNSARKFVVEERQREVTGWLVLNTKQRCFFKLHEKQLVYFQEESEQTELGAIDLTNARCYSTVPHAVALLPRPFCFRIATSTGRNNLLLAAESEDGRRKWVTEILRRASGHLEGPVKRNRVLFFYGRGGGGHKASANAVKDCLAQDAMVDGGISCEVKLEDLGTLMETPVLGEFVQKTFSWLGVPGGDDVYNFLMAKGWYRLADVATRMGANTIESKALAIGDYLCGYLATERPSLVVSYIPFVNRVLREALQHVLPGVRLLTVITDMEHSEAHRWIDRFDSTAAQHTIVAGGRHLQSQAIELGYDGVHVLRTGGMVVHPAYYQTRADPATNTGDTVRARLDATLPTAVLFFGGFGPPLMEQIAEQLLAQFELNLVLLVGKNDGLATRLEDRIARGDPLWTRNPILVDGFIPPATLIEYIGSASCVIGKPGPGVVSEAAVLGVPFVTEHNDRTLAQEVCVVDYVKAEGIGVVVHSLTEAYPEDLFEQLERCRGALSSIQNNAVFDVSAFCQEQAQRANTGLAVNPSQASQLQTRITRQESLPWSTIVTALNDVNADTVSGRYNSFSGAHTFPEGGEGGHGGRLWRRLSAQY